MAYMVDPYKSGRNGRQHKVALTEEHEQLVVQYVPLVKYVVGRMSINLPPGMDTDDLISIGCWGLIDAATKFDSTRGVKFKTYAMTRIRGSILDELRKLSLGGQALCRKAQMIEKALMRVEARIGRLATEAELAEELEMKRESVSKLMAEINSSFLLSLDETTYSSGEPCERRLDTIVDHSVEDAGICAEKGEQKEQLEEAIDALPEQERLVLSLYYYEELTLKEIARIMKVSESRISQIHGKAITHLKVMLSVYNPD